ncbi:MAG: complex I subunit 1 family protein [Thermoproteota archaeon]|jgi:NADH-quinone oxidoreductase subunit H|nr:complex I subunit 1 family protein [Thermoproteota archaeon]
MIDSIITFLKSYPLLIDALRVIVAMILAIIFILINALIFIYVERKVWARTMQRMGPTYVGKWGILQLIADFVKVLNKEIIVPAKANRIAFLSMPVFITGVSLLLIIIMPYDYVVANTLLIFEPFISWFGLFKYAIVSQYFQVGVLLIFVILSFNPIFILLTGWISNNKYSVIGGFRAAAQLLSFEIPFLLSVAAVVVLTGTLNLYEIVERQKNMWLIFLAPLTFILFLITAIAEAERTPFDIPDAESEIIAGWNTEYSASPFLLLIMGMYVRAFVSATLLAIFFFGGWLGPTLPGILAPMSGPLWLMIKTYFFMVLYILIRAAFPRYRIDQLLNLSWTKLLPLSIANLLIVIVLKYYLVSIGFMS